MPKSRCPAVAAPLPSRGRRRAQLAHVVLQPAFGGIEGVADCDIDVLVRLVLPGVAIDYQRRAGHVHDDADIVELAATTALVRRLHRYPATDDPVESVFELRRPFLDSADDEFRRLHAVEVDLDRNLHCAFSLSSPGAGPDRRPRRASFTARATKSIPAIAEGVLCDRQRP